MPTIREYSTTIDSLARVDAAEQLQRRQGAPRSDLQDGRSIPAASSGHRHDVARQTQQASPRLGRPSHQRPARPQAAPACHRRHGQPGGPGDLGHHGPRRNLPDAGPRLGSCLRRASRSARYRAKRLRGPCEVMANRSDRGREQPAVMSRASKPAKQNGTSSAETIRASGHDRANRPYTRLHPTNAPTLTNPLQRGSHPHKTFRLRANSRRPAASRPNR